jgi:hypothetical protein
VIHQLVQFVIHCDSSISSDLWFFWFVYTILFLLFS